MDSYSKNLLLHVGEINRVVQGTVWLWNILKEWNITFLEHTSSSSLWFCFKSHLKNTPLRKATKGPNLVNIPLVWLNMPLCSLLKTSMYTGPCICSEPSFVQSGPQTSSISITSAGSYSGRPRAPRVPRDILERCWRDPRKVTLARGKSGPVALWSPLPLASSQVNFISICFIS